MFQIKDDYSLFIVLKFYLLILVEQSKNMQHTILKKYQESVTL